jgi:hypothetical protein
VRYNAAGRARAYDGNTMKRRKTPASRPSSAASNTSAGAVPEMPASTAEATGATTETSLPPPADAVPFDWEQINGLPSNEPASQIQALSDQELLLGILVQVRSGKVPPLSERALLREVVDKDLLRQFRNWLPQELRDSHDPNALIKPLDDFIVCKAKSQGVRLLLSDLVL